MFKNTAFVIIFSHSLLVMAEDASAQKPTLYELGYQLGSEARAAKEKAAAAAEQVAIKDSQWWGRNKSKAVASRRDYNECVLKHIGNASTNGAVSQVRYSCRQLHWPHEWPEKYLTQPVPN